MPLSHSHASLLADMAQAIRHDDGAAFLRIAALGGAPRDRTAAGLRVHASTTSQTLTHALADAAPTVAAMLSQDAFSELARDFVDRHPPTRAALHDWGNDLPAFLIGRGASPELIAMAQLDRAWMAAFFAADAEPIGPERLMALPSPRIPTARLRLHPSLRLVHLAGPWFAAWLARGAIAQVDGDRDGDADGSLVALARPQARVRAVALTRPAYRFLEALGAGDSLLSACEAASGEGAGFDLQAQLSALFADGLIIECLAGE